jgi:hypothetical protein
LKITYQGRTRAGPFYTVTQLEDAPLKDLLGSEDGKKTLGELLVRDIEEYYVAEKKALKMVKSRA